MKIELNTHSQTYTPRHIRTHYVDITKMWIGFAVSEIVKDNVIDLLTFHIYKKKKYILHKE